MPASLQSSAGAASHRSVLLVEEYDALAAAIGSALKKFAPQHEVSVARSLDQAKKLAAEIAPELFVIDVDPPWPSLTDFLEEMRSAHANARALVIGAAIPAEVAAERRSFGALQFIEKPFELAAFGAAVQALLGPWREPESASSRGTLGALSAIDVLLLHCAARSNVTVEVAAGKKRYGEIYLTEGQVRHAAAGKRSGPDALREILAWPGGEMSESKSPGPLPRTLQRDWIAIVLEILRAAEEPAKHAVAPPEKAPAVQPRTKTGKKVVVIDDTEMLLIFVEDVLATANPELQVTTALNGSEGLKEIERIIPDLVLLDYSLPDLNGDDVCQHLLQNPRTAHVPVLMMSGHVPEMTAAAARLANIVATIEKPFLSDALVDLVRHTLERGPRPQPKTIAPAPPAKVSRPVPPWAPELKPKLVKKAAPPPMPVLEAPESQRVAPPWAPELKPKLVKKAAPSPMPVLEAPESQRVAQPIQPVVRIAPAGENQAVLGLFLEVASMQLTPQLQMGTIRARPISSIVSLHLTSSAVRNAIPAEIGFQLGTTELDGNGRISSIRLIPTAKPFQPAQTRNAFEIGGVAVIPNHARTRVQLTPAGSTPMTMLLVAHLELGAVELSATFQVAQLILKWRTNAVHVTLNPKAPEQSGASFEATAVKLDSAARIAELLLNPIK